MEGSSSKRAKTGAHRPETPLALYKQALRLQRQQACGDTSADAAIEAKLQQVVARLSEARQEQETVQHSLDLDLADEPLFLLASAHWQLGLLHQRRDELEGAEQHLRRALLHFPRFVAATAALGQVLKAAAGSAAQLQEAEAQLCRALSTAQQLAQEEGGLLVEGNKACAAELEAADAARGVLAMLLCQADRADEAAGHLRTLGFKFRLARDVLHYPMPQPGAQQQQQPATSSEECKALQALDGALPPALLQHLQHVFRQGAPFWSQHAYGRVGYFSYFFPLGSAPSSSMHQLAALLQRLAAPFFPEIQDAAYAEFWAHIRRHSSGHQLHFDSDDEGQGGVRHPICTCIVYLAAEAAGSSSSGQQACVVGGPTLATDQVLGGPLATKGWLAYPASNRVLCFDGRFLHGVIPGRGVSPSPGGRRTTLMMAFWRDLKCRTPPGSGAVGACMPLPDPATPDAEVPDGRTWVTQLGCLSDGADGWPGWRASTPVALEQVAAVWEPVDAGGGGSVAAGATYSACFQGF